MKKTFSLRSLLLLSVFAGLVSVSALLVVPQAQAQDGSGFSFGSMFRSVRESVNNQVQRVYLKLPGAKSGKAVLNQAIEATEANLESAQTSTSIQVDASAAGESVMSFQLTAAGPFEFDNVYDPSSVRQDMNIAMSLKMEGTTLEGDVDLKQTEDALYFRLNTVPAIPGIDLSSIKDQWVVVDSTTGEFELEETAVEDSIELTEQQIVQIGAAIDTLLDSIEVGQAQRETKDGNNVFVVVASISDEVLLQFLNDYYVAIEETAALPEIEQSWQEMLSYIQPIEVEFWVDTSNYFFRHMAVSVAAEPSVLQEQLSTVGSSAELYGVSGTEDIDSLQGVVSFDMSNFNQPVAFEEPTDAVPFIEVMSGFIGAPVAFEDYAQYDSLDGFSEEDLGFDPADYGLTEEDLAPAELPELTPEEKALLEEYGFTDLPF